MGGGKTASDLRRILNIADDEDTCSVLGEEIEERISATAAAPKGGTAGAKPEETAGADEPEEVVPFYQVSQDGPNPFFEEAPVMFTPPPGLLPPDKQDSLIPENSFIGDFTYSLKGYESPVLFNIWGALYTISVLSGRQSWFKFGSGKIFPNLYVIWIAKPGVCKKGTALGLATTLLQEIPNQFPDDPYMREERSIDYISSKAPSDAIFMSLKPKIRTFILPDGTLHQANFGSRTYVSATELATFLNTKKFNTGMVDTLTDLFDCKERDRELTRTRGIENFEKFYFCLGGCCTPMHMETSFPPEARGGGFMSRCILVHQEFPTVWHSLPEVYDGFPTQDDLLKRMRYIAYKSRGEYEFTPEAFEEYDRWYHAWRMSLFERGVQDDALAETRMDILTIKVATILRMAEYRPGFDVTLKNYNDAKRLMAYTLSNANRVTRSLGAKERQMNYLKIRRLIQKHVKITRKKLLPLCSSKGVFVQELSSIMAQLVQEGYLKIELGGFTKLAPGTDGRELYTWIGPSYDDELLEDQENVEGVRGA